MTYPVLQTERLTLQKLAVNDLASLSKIANNQLISRFVVNVPFPYTDLNASMRLGYVTKGFEEGSRYCFAIKRGRDDTLIGEISLHLRNERDIVWELGYWIGEAFWNNNYATEAIKAILQFGLEERGMCHIYASCDRENPASERVLLKNGFILHEKKQLHNVYLISKDQ